MSSKKLIVEQNKSKYQDIYEKGYDKKYPNLDLVRLEKWFFREKKGNVLDYGFGVGVNFLHMINEGYPVVGIEVAPKALEIVQEKLTHLPSNLQKNAKLLLLDKDSSSLPLENDSFDYVICLSVLSLLETYDRIDNLISEFHRVMKPGAKMLVDINGPGSDFSKHGKLIKDDLYEYRGISKTEEPRLCYCPQTPERFKLLFRNFVIEDIGHVSFNYIGRESFEYLACVKK